MSALDPERLRDLEHLRGLTSKDLRELGRLPEPMIRRKGEPGFRVVSWEEAYDAAAEGIKAAAPERFAVYVTSRGVLNEHYYAAQKAARAMGTSHVDNSARLCHAASTVAMRRTLGHGATTCSYTDWLGTDLIVFFGSNTANNQPVTMKYLYHARQQGAHVAVVNTYDEPGMRRYWVPSVPESALFGTRIADDWFAVDTGGDLAFLNGVLKVLLAEDWLDHAFVRERTVGLPEARAAVEAQDWDALERASGTSRAEMSRFARMLASARNGILVWSMGLTQHAHGVPTIQALINVGLARGWVGREKTGLMPIRGHSGVQGGAEVGCAPSLDEAQRARFEAEWGFPLPAFPGLTASEMMDAAYRGALDAFWIVGGNFLETLPDPAAAWRALAALPTRIHQDIVLTSMMMVPPQDTAVLFPATTRYESPGGGTRDLHRAPHHLLARRSPDAASARRSRSGRCSGRWRRACGRIATRASPRRNGSATRSRAPSRSTPASRRWAARATRCNGAARASSRTSLRDAGRQGAFLRGRACRSGTRPRAPSTSRPAAASSSTRWCSTRWTRSPAPPARTC